MYQDTLATTDVKNPVWLGRWSSSEDRHARGYLYATNGDLKSNEVFIRCVCGHADHEVSRSTQKNTNGERLTILPAGAPIRISISSKSEDSIQGSYMMQNDKGNFSLTFVAGDIPDWIDYSDKCPVHITADSVEIWIKTAI